MAETLVDLLGGGAGGDGGGGRLAGQAPALQSWLDGVSVVVQVQECVTWFVSAEKRNSRAFAICAVQCDRALSLLRYH